MLIIPKSTTLENGFSIITVPAPEQELVTVMIGVRAGSRMEPPDKKGLAHLAEHVFWKRSKAYGSEEELTRAIAEIGGITNASTAVEFMDFYIQCPKENGVRAVEILRDMVMDPSIDEGELEREKLVTIQEFSGVAFNDMSRVDAMMDSLMFGHGSCNMNWDLLSYFRDNAAFTSRDIMDFHARYFQPQNMTLVIIGGGDIGKISAKAKMLFSEYEKGVIPSVHSCVDAGHDDKRLSFDQIASDETTICVGLKSVPMGHPDSAGYSLIAKILGSGIYRHTRLLRHVRSRFGFVYSIFVNHDQYSDIGRFSIFTQTSAQYGPFVTKLIEDEVVGIDKSRITEEELAMAKAQLCQEIRSGPMNHEKYCQSLIAEMLLCGRVSSPETNMETVHGFSLKKISTLAKSLSIQKPYYAIRGSSVRIAPGLNFERGVLM